MVISNKSCKKIFSSFAIASFIIVLFIPSLQANSDFQLKYKVDEKSYENQTNVSLLRCYFFIYGKISNPRIIEYNRHTGLHFYAEKVHVIGFGVSYDGLYTITQWIYNEEVQVNWKGEGPDFRGLVTNNFIIGSQRSRWFEN